MSEEVVKGRVLLKGGSMFSAEIEVPDYEPFPCWLYKSHVLEEDWDDLEEGVFFTIGKDGLVQLERWTQEELDENRRKAKELAARLNALPRDG